MECLCKHFKASTISYHRENGLDMPPCPGEYNFKTHCCGSNCNPLRKSREEKEKDPDPDVECVTECPNHLKIDACLGCGVVISIFDLNMDTMCRRCAKDKKKEAL